MAVAQERAKLIFRKTEKALLRLSSELSAEAVHGFRTTSRRLQTLLEEIVPGHSRPQRKLLKILNRIRTSAGKVRDIDVQLAALRSLKTSQEPRRKTQLAQRLIELRARHERMLHKLLTEKDIRDARKRLKRVAVAVEFESSVDPLAAAKRMLGTVVIPADPADEEPLHHYRTVVKRARYAAEFAPRSAEVAKFLAQLKPLQDTLGHWHDWQTLTHTAIERLGDVNQSPLVAALNNVTRGKFRSAMAAVSYAQSNRAALQKKPTLLESDRKQETRKLASVDRSGAAA